MLALEKRDNDENILEFNLFKKDEVYREFRYLEEADSFQKTNQIIINYY